MDALYELLKFLLVVFYYIIIIKIWMIIANFIGQRLGVDKFILNLCARINNLIKAR